MRDQCEVIDVKCLVLVSSISARYEVPYGSPWCQCKVPVLCVRRPRRGVPVPGADVKCPVRLSRWGPPGAQCEVTPRSTR